MHFLVRPDGVRLAYQYLHGIAPTMVFLPGFGGDMSGRKASYLRQALAAAGRSVLLLDYSGHGQSEGRFEDGTVGRWRDDALLVIDRMTRGRLVLVGSSMGGWIALLIALARPGRVAGVVGIAAAPDFTERRVWGSFDAAQRGELMRHGHVTVDSSYATGLHISRALIEDGRRNALMDGPIALDVPVRLMQGLRDAEVARSVPLDLADLIQSEDVQVTFIKDGEHELSRPSDLPILLGLVEELLGREDGG